MTSISKLPVLIAALTLVGFGTGSNSAQAVELLVNGDLEASVAPVGWMVEQTVTGLPGATVNASEQVSFANQPTLIPGELGIFLRPFAGNQGSYADQNHQINYILSQTVNVAAAAAGKTWTFSGHSYFGGDADPLTNDGYSGGVELLHSASPSDPTPENPDDPPSVPSPTDTIFELTFLDLSDNVLETTIFDLRDEQMNDAMWRQHMVEAVAPANTRKVRVTAAATDMVDNNGFQNAYLDNFRLERSDLAGNDFLVNGNLNMAGPPSGFELIETPEGADSAAFRDFANHTPGGQQGLWLRAFAGQGGETVDAVMTQTVPGVAGGDYTFSAWSKWEVGYSGGIDPTGAQNSETVMQLEFLDSASSVIGVPLSLDLFAAGQRNGADWQQYFLNGTAPAGTENVRISVAGFGMFNTETNPQSAFFDDLSLDLAVAGVPGDYNNNGTVDAADYVLWRKGGPLENEVVTPGAATPEDYTEWRARFGNTSGAGSAGALATAPVPEPAAFGLVIVGLLAGTALRRRL